MYLSAAIDDKLVLRPYTPVTSVDEQGYFQLIIKVCAIVITQRLCVYTVYYLSSSKCAINWLFHNE